MKRRLTLAGCMLAATLASRADAVTTGTFTLNQDDARGQLRASFNNAELFVYNYGDEFNLTHFFPLNTPSGKNLLVQKIEPYPHHRAFWVSDTVERDGVRGDIYNGYYSGKNAGKKEYQAPFNTATRHVSFDITTGTPGMATIQEKLVWETGRTTTTFPLLDEHRKVNLIALEDGDYLIDFTFNLKASYGDVRFISDAVHYSWPYLRLNSRFSVTGGATLTADNGTTGQAATNLKPAQWIDYSNTVDGQTEGVAMFQWPDENGQPRKWLTRDYGTFGPRRPDAQSGRKFILKKNDSLSQRVAVYVHVGNVTTGKVAEVYQKYVRGEIGK